jgi:hypothetical protein
MARDTIFRISSMTKPVTAVAALILVEECELRLDDPVDALLPEPRESPGSPALRQPARRHRACGPARSPCANLLTFRLGYGIVAEPPGLYPVQDALNELNLGQGPPGSVARPRPTNGSAASHASTHASTGREVDVQHRLPTCWAFSSRARPVSRSRTFSARTHLRAPRACVTPGSTFGPARSTGSRPATRPTPTPGALSVHDEPGGQWSRPPAFPSGSGRTWSRRSTTSSRSADAGELRHPRR